MKKLLSFITVIAAFLVFAVPAYASTPNSSPAEPPDWFDAAPSIPTSLQV